MDWHNCISSNRTGVDHSQDQSRTQFQRDYDRIIFSTAFRRLQNKTQVFPLPGSTLVHNRLTHSLEVASVGRSLGVLIGKEIAKSINYIDTKIFYQTQLPIVLSAACLAHDIGNPAFGHSGEKAISTYFRSNEHSEINSTKLKDYFSDLEWQDLIKFEGNANALRLLTKKYEGKATGGMRLSMTTLASILKYPCSSTQANKKYKHRSKYGYFQSDKSVFNNIAASTGMIEDDNAEGIYKRHPFVYLVEAADDICYRIMDMEDAHRLGILDAKQAHELFITLLEGLTLDATQMDRIHTTLKQITDRNESIAYLRANIINRLTQASVRIFLDNESDILSGNYNSTLLDDIEKDCPILKEMMKVSIDKIYNHSSVLEIEIAGYNVMNFLLGLFIPYILDESKNRFGLRISNLIPDQFKPENYPEASAYEKTMLILDFVSGMTDSYAAELYRKTTGIEFSRHK